jgi:hypothetical protein
MSMKVFTFFLTTEAASDDPKTTVLKVKGFQKAGDDATYELPDSYQALKTHTVLLEIPAIKSAISSMKTRGLYRKISVSLPPDSAKIYIDSEGNAIFQKEYLNIATVDFVPLVKKIIGTKIDANNEPEGASVKKSLQSITKDFVLDKFAGKNANAENWITLFECECERMKVPTEQYTDALRLFLEGSASEWYSAMRMTLGTITWAVWKKTFKETYENKGWSDLWMAYNFSYKYYKGTLSEFATKKLNLLVNADSDLTERSRVGHIVTSLPTFVQSRINRAKVDTFAKLMNELMQIEDGFGKGNQKGNIGHDKKGFMNAHDKKTGSFNRKRKHCEYCTKKGRNGTTHDDDECYANPQSKRNNNNSNSSGSKYSDKTGSVRLSHNTELEDLLNEQENAKN